MVFSSCVILLLILQVRLAGVETFYGQILISTTSPAGCPLSMCSPGCIGMQRHGS